MSNMENIFVELPSCRDCGHYFVNWNIDDAFGGISETGCSHKEVVAEKFKISATTAVFGSFGGLEIASVDDGKICRNFAWNSGSEKRKLEWQKFARESAAISGCVCKCKTQGER